MPTIQLELPRPHPAQARIIREARRYNVVCCGRRRGKTTLGMDRVIRLALDGRPAGEASRCPVDRPTSNAGLTVI
jgi:hypothetical protein